MATKDEVYQLLAATNEYVSGEALARTLGKSRAAVWKAVNALKKDGVLIDAVTNRGYRLSEKNDALRADDIASKLKIPAQVRCYPTVDSTNTEAKRLLAEGCQSRLLLVAEEQTAGRGRQGKSFYSPAGTGIYMSLAVHPMAHFSDVVSCTTAAAVAVCRAIEALTDKKPEIKWVNDVYLDGKKICGILTEAVSDFETQTVQSVIIGIGMNLHTVTFPAGLENAASLNADVRRADLIARIVNELDAVLGRGYDAFMEDYRARSMLLGKEIQFLQNGVATAATALAVDDTGGLVVATKEGKKITLRSGEVSIVMKKE